MLEFESFTFAMVCWQNASDHGNHASRKFEKPNLLAAAFKAENANLFSGLCCQREGARSFNAAPTYIDYT